jgi:hypothetical protein
MHDMPPARGVLLVELSETCVVEAICQPDHGGPESAVNERHLPVEEATHKDVGCITESAGRTEDLIRGRVRPPTTPDRLSREKFGDTRNRSTSRFQQNALLLQHAMDVHDDTLRPSSGR